MLALETQTLGRRFGAQLVVEAVSLSVEAGTCFALLGPNGAGKTTTVKMLTTLLPPSSGAARVAGLDVLRQSAGVRRIIGYVPQLISADGMLTGAENLELFARLYDVPRAVRAARVQNALEFMGLADVGNQLVRHYSGGMIRRLEIAQAILHHPRVLFLDEPTTGLDPVARQAVWKHLQHLRTALGMTVFFTTHFMEEADQWCTRLAVMVGGRIAAEGTPTQLKRRLGCEGATLNHVYIRYAGHAPQVEGAYCDTARTRRNNHRLG